MHGIRPLSARAAGATVFQGDLSGRSTKERTMKIYPIVTKVMLLAALASGAISAQAAGDVAAGRAKAKGCANCHGIDGKGTIPLAGKKAAYLEEQLRAFKSGRRGRGGGGGGAGGGGGRGGGGRAADY